MEIEEKILGEYEKRLAIPRSEGRRNGLWELMATNLEEEKMTRTKTFLLTLKAPIQVQQRRLDDSPIILKTATLQVEWPLSDSIEDGCAANTCGHGDVAVCRNTLKTIEAPQIDLRVTGFVSVGDARFWQSPVHPTSCEPFSLQVKRDNILSRQDVAFNAPEQD